MEEKTKRAAGRFAPGASGNAKGRPRNKSDLAHLRASIATMAPKIIEVLVAQALSGDVGAARILIERALAPLRAIDTVTPIKLPGTSLADDGRAVLAAVAAGELAPAAAAALIGAIGNLARVVELDEMAGIVAALEARITAMEAR